MRMTVFRAGGGDGQLVVTHSHAEWPRPDEESRRSLRLTDVCGDDEPRAGGTCGGG